MNESRYKGAGTRGGRWGCALAALVGAPVFAFAVLVASLGDCMPEVNCHRHFWLEALLPTFLVALPFGLGARWLINRRATDNDSEQEASARVTGPRASASPSYLLQICFVALVAVVGVLATDALAFRSPVNAVWFIGFPLAIGVLANLGWKRRCLMAVALLALSIAMGTFVGVNYTSYG